MDRIQQLIEKIKSDPLVFCVEAVISVFSVVDHPWLAWMDEDVQFTGPIEFPRRGLLEPEPREKSSSATKKNRGDIATDSGMSSPMGSVESLQSAAIDNYSKPKTTLL